MHNLGTILEKLQRQALDGRRRILGSEAPETLVSLNDLVGRTLSLKGNDREAEKLLQEAVKIERRVLGPEDRRTTMSMEWLAMTLIREGKFAEAETLDRENVEIKRHLLGPEHPNTLDSMGLLATAIDGEGRYVEAEKLLREVIDQRRVLGPENPGTAIATYNLGCLAARQGTEIKRYRFCARQLTTDCTPALISP